MSPDDARIAALAEYAILDTAPEAEFDDIATIASALCGAPVALISLVDRDRQWFKARAGFDATETDLERSVCAHGLASAELLIIPDLTRDARTAANPLVTADPHIRFYAGAPLAAPEGTVLGMLCVIDTTPRPAGLTAPQQAGLQALARQVMALLEARRTVTRRDAVIQRQRDRTVVVLERALASESAEQRLRASEERARVAEEAGGIGTYSVDVATDTLNVSPGFCRLFGVPVTETLPAARIMALLIEDDVPRVSNETTRRDGSAELEVEYRIRRPDDGRVRWILRRGGFSRDAEGRVVAMAGIVSDVTELRRSSLLMRALVELGDRLRTATTSAAVSLIAGEVLGRAIDAAGAGFTLVEEPGDSFLVEAEWSRSGTPCVVGRYGKADFPEGTALLAQGEPVIVEDIATDPRAGPESASLAPLPIRAGLQVPLMQGGELDGVFFAYDDKPRVWTAAEVDFARSVGDRAHAAMGKVKSDAQQRMLNEELSHRLKNTLAMVQAISSQTLRGVSERDLIGAFERRLQTLAQAHDVLMQQHWSSASITHAIGAVMTGLGVADRVDLKGEDVALGSRVTLSLSLMLHELTTNAMKYGALSNETGRVALGWRIEDREEIATLALAWRERGGPPVEPAPVRRGFGSRLIRSGLVGTGGVEVRHPATGFEVDIAAPLAQVQRS